MENRSRPAGSIQRLLVPLDGSPLAEGALPHAVAVAGGFEAEVLLLRVVGNGAATQPHEGTDAAAWRLEHLEAERYLAEIAGRLRAAGVSVEYRTAVGKASEQILAVERTGRVDLILLSTHGAGGVTEFPLSGTATKVLAAAQSSVLLIPAGKGAPMAAEPTRLTRVLVPVDGSKRSDWAILLAACIARKAPAELVLLHVLRRPELFGEPGAGADASRLADRLLELNAAAARAHLEGQAGSLASTGLSVRYRIETNTDVSHSIERVAREEDASLVVVSAHGHAPRTERPYGAVTGALLQYGARPLLVLQDLVRRETIPLSMLDVRGAQLDGARTGLASAR